MLARSELPGWRPSPRYGASHEERKKNGISPRDAQLRNERLVFPSIDRRRLTSIMITTAPVVSHQIKNIFPRLSSPSLSLLSSRREKGSAADFYTIEAAR